MSFFIKLATTKKAHGRWGDLISGLLPLFWCFNILLNSNFLLKLNEWQTECNLFTLRIRGKQWYWVYKMNVHVNEKLMYLNLNFAKSKSKIISNLNINNGKKINNFWRNIFFQKIMLKDIEKTF